MSKNDIITGSPEWLNNIVDPLAKKTINAAYENSIKLDTKVQQTAPLLLESISPTGEIINQDKLNQIFEVCKLYRSGSIVEVENGEAVINGDIDHRFMASSTSKRFIMEQVARELETLGITFENSRIFQLTVASIQEMFGRGQANFLFTKFPGLIIEIDRLINDGLNESKLLELRDDRDRDEETKSIVEKLVESASKLTGEELNAILIKAAAANELVMDFDELSYCTLSVSCNTTNSIAMNTLYEEWEKKGLTNSRRESEELFAAKIQETVAPDYELRINSDDRFFRQPASNSINAADMQRDVISQVQRLRESNNNFDFSILNAMSNNKINFKLDFSTTPEAQNLIKLGYKVIEKTGTYDCVYWMPELVKDGCPPHMMLLTTITIISPSDKSLTMTYYEMIHVPFSQDIVPQNNGAVTGWPDEESLRYQAFGRAFQSEHLLTFRSNFWNELEPQLQNLN